MAQQHPKWTTERLLCHECCPHQCGLKHYVEQLSTTTSYFSVFIRDAVLYFLSSSIEELQNSSSEEFHQYWVLVRDIKHWSDLGLMGAPLIVSAHVGKNALLNCCLFTIRHPLQLNFIIITGVSLGWFPFNIVFHSVFHQSFPGTAINFRKLSKKLGYEHGRL